MYNTNRNPTTDFDCFYAYIVDIFDRKDGTYLHTNHLTPYCRRLTSIHSINEIEGYVQNKMTFKTLRSQRIESEELLKWSISIDIIEQYAIYLMTNDTKFDDYMFYNCSSLWFGSHCQYTSGLNLSTQSFGDLIVTSFNNRKQFSNNLTINTCYPHLFGCYRGPTPICLDWREICNGIIDCIGDHYGIDEEYCEELEINECNENEYRCHNGAQCIPFEFFHDGWTSTDCLDGTDEDDIIQNSVVDNDYIRLDCIKLSTFNCEERSCRDTRSFPCGDGDCYIFGLLSNYIFPYSFICPGTNRESSYLQTIYTGNKHLSNDCFKLIFCKLKIYVALPTGTYDIVDCLSDDWLSSNNCSMDYVSFPTDPIFVGYFQVIYSTKSLVNNLFNDTPPDYVCNNPRECLHLPKTTLQIGGLDCRPFDQLAGEFYAGDLYHLYSAFSSSSTLCTLLGNKNVYKSNSSLFYCQLSDKHISKHRIRDGISDCYYKEDERYSHSCLLNDSHRFHCKSEEICISPVGIGFALPNCPENEDTKFDQYRPTVFALLCDHNHDGVRDGNENDETNCEWWPCNNPYTRCDGVFQCANGIDEVDCPSSGCANNELKCDIQNSAGYRCIPQDYIYEKPINCSMNYGNKSICRRFYYSRNLTNNKTEYLSWKEKTCLTDNDICGQQSNNNQHLLCNLVGISKYNTCGRLLLNIDDNEPMCALTSHYLFMRVIGFFSVYYLGYLPPLINTTLLSSHQPTQVKQTKIFSMNSSIELIEYCNRGIIIYEGKSYTKKCLCPPSYYGDQCEWQNQRVSLTIQIHKMSSFEKMNSIYDIFIYLIDNQYQIIHSYEKINYIPTKDCQMKYNRYLLYPTKPKSLNSNYSIHIDMYDKITLDYYGSWYLSIPFQFLPVNRLATQIIIPSEKSTSLKNCSLECGNHGNCYNYINSTKSFCHCDQGYSGRFCHLSSNCSCSSDSICLNTSICLCPINKYGSQCYLKHPFCLPDNPCQNKGQCIPIDDRINKYDYICLCTEDYTGLNCEHKSNRIDIHFKTDVIPSIIFAHFITAFDDKQQERTTKFKKVPFDQQSITLFISQSFHLLFIEYFNNSYLTVLRETFIPSEHISTDINIDNMCTNITELFNSTILSYKNLRRYKYYQLPCLQNLTLKCFYDEIHMCVCDQNRFSNCFEFNHNMTYNCQGNNQCQNNGKCFQDNATCPQISICMCQKCYYGTKCQLTTKGFSLSLDVIFGYHIKPFISFLKQATAVKITISLTIVMFVCSVISGSLSILVFRRKPSLEVGCGKYLLISSITSLLTISIFTIKYCQLLVFQMNVITNRSFLYYNCLLTDVLLKTLLSSGDWLNACVAIERAFTAIQGVSFNKSKSRFIAKCIIPLIFFVTIISYIHDPISRQLYDDKDEERIWCIVDYSSQLKIYDKFINLFHFLTPFIINFLSALIIIIQVFRTRSKLRTNSSQSILYMEIKRHKHILISPCILIVLAFPRLLISLSSRCMESAHNPWLFLTGYYFSFIPPLLIFIVFVLPSEKYRNEFFTVIRRQRLTSQ